MAKEWVYKRIHIMLSEVDIALLEELKNRAGYDETTEYLRQLLRAEAKREGVPLDSILLTLRQKKDQATK